MKLITGLNEHEKEIISTIGKSIKIQIAVAFVKQSGVDIIMERLVNAAKKGAAIDIICGLDFGQTEPDALKKLYKLDKKYERFNLFLASPPKRNQIFHPKIYSFFLPQEVVIIAGSANLTSGGLRNNNELSILNRVAHNDTIAKDTDNYFAQLKASGFCQRASMLRILEYQGYFEKQKALRRSIIAKPTINAELPFNLKKLKKYYEEYKKGFDTDQIFRNKMNDYANAKKILNQIADDATLTKSKFTDLFETLVGSSSKNKLWHSNGINRKKTTVFNQYKIFQKLVRYIRDNKNGNLASIFEEAKNIVSQIEGSGVNTFAEIMMTYNPKKFANLNANPIKALRDGLEVPLKSHRNSFNGEDYENYCMLVDEINQVLELRNMLEADSFFNNIYQKLKKRDYIH